MDRGARDARRSANRENSAAKKALLDEYRRKHERARMKRQWREVQDELRYRDESERDLAVREWPVVVVRDLHAGDDVDDELTR